MDCTYIALFLGPKALHNGRTFTHIHSQKSCCHSKWQHPVIICVALRITKRLQVIQILIKTSGHFSQNFCLLLEHFFYYYYFFCKFNIVSLMLKMKWCSLYSLVHSRACALLLLLEQRSCSYYLCCWDGDQRMWGRISHADSCDIS